jgi:hypothetical protein
MYKVEQGRYRHRGWAIAWDGSNGIWRLWPPDAGNGGRFWTAVANRWRTVIASVRPLPSLPYLQSEVCKVDDHASPRNGHRAVLAAGETRVGKEMLRCCLQALSPTPLAQIMALSLARQTSFNFDF